MSAQPAETGVAGSEKEAVAKQQAAHADINLHYYSMRPSKFHFKKSDLGERRPTVELTLPFPTLTGVEHWLQDEKIAAYILDVLGEDIYLQARTQVSDETKPVNSQEELDLSKLTIEYIANMPAAERRGGGIAKETWEMFAKDYIDTMVPITGKTIEQVTNAAKLFTSRLQAVKTQKQVLKRLREYLSLWFTKSTNAEELKEVYEFLDRKAGEFLAMDESQMLQNL
jgi:hypothetical protein